MKYLLPVGGITHTDFGILTTPSHKAVPVGIKAGLSWAADNEAYTKSFDSVRYADWLTTMEPYRTACLFVTCPDRVGDAMTSLDLFAHYRPMLDGWPVAFVAQDGQEYLPFPDSALWQVLFIGGTTAWKDGIGALACIEHTMQLHKRIHIGRVNEWRRYDKFAQLEKGYQYEFTADGTKNRYIGVERAVRRFRSFYQRSQRQDRLSLPDSDCPR